MKQFAVFTYSQYYPGGGWNDYKGSYETEAEAVEAAKGRGDDWWQVVDLTTQQVVTWGPKS